MTIIRIIHWAIRVWDFPKVQITVMAGLFGMLYAVMFFKGSWIDGLFIASMIATVGWQGFRIMPYTVLSPVQVLKSDGLSADAQLRIITSNVLQTSQNFERWLKVIRRETPDLILALETDEKWENALKVLNEEYPHRVTQVQSNKYGMMLFSRFRLENKAVRFLVEKDIPSIRTDMILNNGERVRFYGIHPRPPEPIGDVDASARDAELIVTGKEIRNEKLPVLVAGDLNDVAWSKTTGLFIKISGLLDPRRGRGFCNTFPANLPFLRWSLDHIFHSNTFQLDEMRIFDRVGSDHLPVLIHLAYEPQDQFKQPEPEADHEEEKIAQSKVARETSVNEPAP